MICVELSKILKEEDVVLILLVSQPSYNRSRSLTTSFVLREVVNEAAISLLVSSIQLSVWRKNRVDPTNNLLSDIAIMTMF